MIFGKYKIKLIFEVSTWYSTASHERKQNRNWDLEAFQWIAIDLPIGSESALAMDDENRPQIPNKTTIGYYTKISVEIENTNILILVASSPDRWDGHVRTRLIFQGVLQLLCLYRRLNSLTSSHSTMSHQHLLEYLSVSWGQRPCLFKGSPLQKASLAWQLPWSKEDIAHVKGFNMVKLFPPTAMRLGFSLQTFPFHGFANNSSNPGLLGMFSIIIISFLIKEAICLFPLHLMFLYHNKCLLTKHHQWKQNHHKTKCCL